MGVAAPSPAYDLKTWRLPPLAVNSGMRFAFLLELDGGNDVVGESRARHADTAALRQGGERAGSRPVLFALALLKAIAGAGDTAG
jgi:hypothetical protein